MNNLQNPKHKRFSKEIFRTGEYVQHFNPDDRWNPFIKLYKQKKQDTLEIINKSNAPKTVLDIGGAMGRLSKVLSQSAHNNVFLADISIDMLKLAKKHADIVDRLRLVNSDAHQLSFQDSSFDYIVGLDLFCHLQKPEKALSEFHRVLKNQGLLILDSTNSNPLWTLFYPRYLGKNPVNWFKTMKFNGVLPGWQNIVKHYPKKVFYSSLQEIGFEIVKTINYGPVLWPKWHLAVSKKRI